jgi:hypothetical protein
VHATRVKNNLWNGIIYGLKSNKICDLYKEYKNHIIPKTDT